MHLLMRHSHFGAWGKLSVLGAYQCCQCMGCLALEQAPKSKCVYMYSKENSER